ncbi:antitoxin Xre-like helix-turn-helix domain-containing protein [Hymenobacter algoricola]|uniref:Antitoxin Xre-like helix-turn-helix domain-containing protein n=1 Tax=Hymenobacter algoricola TaxID=486267 RepID=A0ABP7NLM1_9BACT
MRKPTRGVSAADTPLEGRVRAYWGLTQGELGRLLGVSQAQLANDVAGTRPLPPDASYRLRMLGRLLPEPGAPEPAPPPPDRAPLEARLIICLDQARRLRFRLSHELPARARPAIHRLAHAASLPAALAATETDAPLPPRKLEDRQAELTLLHNAALTELEDRSGPGPVALLRARLAGLLAEAGALTKALAAPPPGPDYF